MQEMRDLWRYLVHMLLEGQEVWNKLHHLQNRSGVEMGWTCCGTCAQASLHIWVPSPDASPIPLCWGRGRPSQTLQLTERLGDFTSQGTQLLAFFSPIHTTAALGQPAAFTLLFREDRAEADWEALKVLSSEVSCWAWWCLGLPRWLREGNIQSC